MGDDGWQPIETAPPNVGLLTARAGEKGANISWCRRIPGEADEWIDCCGRTTVTHRGSFLPQTHWQHIPSPPAAALPLPPQETP